VWDIHPRADGGTLTHGELRCSDPVASLPMPRTRAQRGETVEDGWAELPDELVEKVLELLQAAGQSEPQDEGLGFFQATATMRLVCAAWKAVHDAMVKRLVLTRKTTDEAMGVLVRLFPTVVSLEFKYTSGGPPWGVLTDQGMLAVSNLTSLKTLNLTNCIELTDEGMRAVSSLPALTSLNLTGCELVTDDGMRAVSSLPALTSLNIRWCQLVSDEGMRAVSSLPALTSLDISWCQLVTDDGVRAVSSCSALTSLNLSDCVEVTDAGVRAVSSCSALVYLNLTWCVKITDAGLRAVSGLPALKFLGLNGCDEVTAAGVQALRNTTAAPSLRIEWYPIEEEDSEGSEDGEDWVADI
jgi:hypothetical protein